MRSWLRRWAQWFAAEPALRPTPGPRPGFPHAMTEHPPADDSIAFRRGVSYAAHMLRHAVGAAHGADEDLSPYAPRVCCQLTAWALGVQLARGLDDVAGAGVDEREHVEGSSRSGSGAP